MINTTINNVSEARKPATQRLLDTIMAFADAHLTEKATLREVAEHCGVSVSTVTQTLQKEMGISFHRYLTNRRMELARELIASGISLEEAGRRVGYSDHSSFYRAFCQVVGMSPREFKRQIAMK